MPLFGAKTSVDVSPETNELVAGEILPVRVTVGAIDGKVQGGRVELLYRNTYRKDETDSEGDRDTVRRTTEEIVVTVPLGSNGSLEQGETEVELRVPADAPGTAPGSVEWRVRALIDRRRGRDARDEAPLTVLAPAEACRSWADSPPEIPASCPMSIDASTRLVRPGDRISGTLRLSPREALSARSLRMQLQRQRKDPDRNVDASEVGRVEISGPIELGAGQEHAVPFELEVPRDASPSFRARHNEQHWYLEAVVDRKRASDPVGRLEVVVFNG